MSFFNKWMKKWRAKRKKTNNKNENFEGYSKQISSIYNCCKDVENVGKNLKQSAETFHIVNKQIDEKFEEIMNFLDRY